MKSGQGMRQPQMGGSHSQLTPTPVLGRSTRGTKTVTIDGIGTADYTLPEWRHIRRLIDGADTDYHREEALRVAELTHAVKVFFPGAELVTGPEDEVALPGEQGKQMELA